MTEIIEYIDAWTLNRYSAYQTKLYGFCELMRKTSDGKSEQVFPVTIPGRVQVSIDDKKTFITWIRWIQPVTYEDNPEWSFGKSESRFGNLPLRLVLVHRTSLGEDVVFDFINAFPSKFMIPGFKLVFVKADLSIDPDHEAIIQTELGPANYLVYEKHRFNWNVYVLNLSFQFLECEATT